MKRLISLCILCLALAACQTAPLTSTGPKADQQTSAAGNPIEQSRAFIFAPTVVVTGSGADKGAGVTVHGGGISADGDIRTLDSTKGASVQATTNQTSTPTQTVAVDPEAVAKAAGTLLAAVDPASPAANLAGQAVAAAKGGDGAKAQALLAAANAASKTAAPKVESPAPSPAPAPAEQPAK